MQSCWDWSTIYMWLILLGSLLHLCQKCGMMWILQAPNQALLINIKMHTTVKVDVQCACILKYECYWLCSIPVPSIIFNYVSLKICSISEIPFHHAKVASMLILQQHEKMNWNQRTSKAYRHADCMHEIFMHPRSATKWLWINLYNLIAAFSSHACKTRSDTLLHPFIAYWSNIGVYINVRCLHQCCWMYNA